MNVHAVIVGVDQYESLGGVLLGCKNDASEFFTRLTMLREPWTLGTLYPLYYDKGYSISDTPTKAHILKAIKKLHAKNTDDYVIFYFAGHGVYQPQSGHYLLPIDYVDGELKETALLVQDIIARLRDADFNNIILFIDACRLINQGTRGFSGQDKNWSPIERPGVLAFQACDHDEVSYEIPGLKHGLFTKALLEVWEPNSNLDFNSLNQKMHERMEELRNQHGLGKQTCCLRADPIEKANLLLPMWSRKGEDLREAHSLKINYPSDGMQSEQLRKCNGEYNGSWEEGQIWAILRDKWNNCYLQFPSCALRPDNTWFQENLCCGENIVKLEIVEVGLMGQSQFKEFRDKSSWGAFSPPSDMIILDSIDLEPYS